MIHIHTDDTHMTVTDSASRNDIFICTTHYECVAHCLAAIHSYVYLTCLLTHMNLWHMNVLHTYESMAHECTAHYYRFHWRFCTPDFHQIEKLKFLRTNSN